MKPINYRRGEDTAEEQLRLKAASVDPNVPADATVAELRQIIARADRAQTAERLGVVVNPGDSIDEISRKIHDAIPDILEAKGIVRGARIFYPGAGKCRVGEYKPDSDNIILYKDGRAKPGRHPAEDVALRATLL